jgi:protein SCO1/2
VRAAVFLVVLATGACSRNAGTDASSANAAEAVRARPAPAERADPGRIVPALPLIDQDGRPFTLRDFSGRVLVTTFIFTRCPMPDFCPLMVRHLETVREQARAAGFGDRLALLGVTLDPAFDTPAVLQAYGRSVLKGTDRFDRWTLATGSREQVAAVTGYFGVASQDGGGGELPTHSLMTAVIGHDGRVMKLFPANSWRPEDLLAAVRVGVDRLQRRP